MSYFDFNTASEQSTGPLIPKGTLIKVRMSLRPGGYDDPNQGWTGGYATRSVKTGSVYLDCEFVVLEGEYARRKLWSLIGLYSPKGPEWGNMGRTFIKAILNSARGLQPNDASPAAQNARRIRGFEELDGIEFLGKVDWEKDQNGSDRNVLKMAITPDHTQYASLMGAVAGTPSAVPAAAATPTASTPNAYAQASGRGPVSTRPSWAQ